MEPWSSTLGIRIQVRYVNPGEVLIKSPTLLEMLTFNVVSKRRDGLLLEQNRLYKRSRSSEDLP